MTHHYLLQGLLAFISHHLTHQVASSASAAPGG